jgi:hypothetical protein
MTRFRLRLPSPAMVVALIALLVALGGSAYAAVKIGPNDIMRGAVRTAHLKDEDVKINDVAPIARFRRATGLVGEQLLTRLGSLELRYACINNGSFVQTVLFARTTVDNAFADVGFITGSDGFGSSFYSPDPDFDTGETFDLDRNRSFGSGSFVYATPAGAVVSVSYGFWVSGVGCFAHGVVTGG